MTDSLREIGPQFERATGYKLVFLFAGTPELIRQAASGAPFDLGVVPVDVMREGPRGPSSPPGRRPISPASATASPSRAARRSPMSARPTR
jgi:hypothetical protein